MFMKGFRPEAVFQWMQMCEINLSYVCRLCLPHLLAVNVLAYL